MVLFLLSLAYRVFRNPFMAWSLLSFTLVLLFTAIIKTIVLLFAPGLMQAETMRGSFQLANFAFIPLAVYLMLAQTLWNRFRQAMLPQFSDRAAYLLTALWLGALIGLLGYNLSFFPGLHRS